MTREARGRDRMLLERGPGASRGATHLSSRGPRGCHQYVLKEGAAGWRRHTAGRGWSWHWEQGGKCFIRSSRAWDLRVPGGSWGLGGTSHMCTPSDENAGASLQ